MRALFLYTALAAADTQKCATGHFGMVSQSSKGTGVQKQHIEPKGQPAQDLEMTLNISSAFDVDAFNMVQSVHAETQMQNQTMPVTMKQIVNFQSGSITSHVSVGGSDPECRVMKMPAKVTRAIKLLKFVLGQVCEGNMPSCVGEMMYHCVGSQSNGMDRYAADIPPAWLPVPLPVEVHTTVDVDSDLLVHAETVKEDINMKGTKAHVEVSMTFHEVSAGGPTEEDMVVPESWGCKEYDMDIDEMLADSKTVGEFRKLLRAIRLMKELKHEEHEVVV